MHALAEDHPPLKSDEDVDVSMVVAVTPIFPFFLHTICNGWSFLFSICGVRGVLFIKKAGFDDGFSYCSNSINGIARVESEKRSLSLLIWGRGLAYL